MKLDERRCKKCVFDGERFHQECILEESGYPTIGRRCYVYMDLHDAARDYAREFRAIRRYRISRGLEATK